MASDLQAVLFALGAALSWGLSSTFVRAGLRYVPTALGTLVSLLVGLAVTATAALLLQRDALLEISLSAAAGFALVGILNFPFGRYMNFLSIQHLGVGRSVPLTSASPLFGMLFAVVFTGEDLSLTRLAGAALVLGGVYVTLRSATPVEAPP